MRVKIEWYPEGARRAARREDIIIISDALRASSMIVTALALGIEEIYIVGQVYEVLTLKERMPEAAAAQEDRSFPSEEYDIGISPSKLVKAKEKPKGIILRSTSGTRTAKAAFEEDPGAIVLMASPLNASAVARKAEEIARKLDKDVTIVCSGFLGKEFALEDFMTAGLIGKKMNFDECGDDLRAAMLIAEMFQKNREEYMKMQEVSKSAIRLKSLGEFKDVDFCLREDVYDIAPLGSYEGEYRNTPLIRFVKA